MERQHSRNNSRAQKDWSGEWGEWIVQQSTEQLSRHPNHIKSLLTRGYAYIKKGEHGVRPRDGSAVTVRPAIGNDL
jgi:hypothetical protein